MLSMGTEMTEKDLLEIIRRQSEQIDQLIAENKALKAEIARLKKRIEELKRRARKYAAPFSREKQTADPKSPGRRPGEGSFVHKAPPTSAQITRSVQVDTPNTCPRCGFVGPLVFTRQDKAWVTELAPRTPCRSLTLKPRMDGQEHAGRCPPIRCQCASDWFSPHPSWNSGVMSPRLGRGKLNLRASVPPDGHPACRLERRLPCSAAKSHPQTSRSKKKATRRSP